MSSSTSEGAVRGAFELLDAAPSPFEVSLAPARAAVRVKPAGELDLATVSVLDHEVTELLAVGFEQLIIDLRGLSFIDVSGLRLLLGLADRARCEGWRLSLVQGNEPVRRVFTLTDSLAQLPFLPLAGGAVTIDQAGLDQNGCPDRSPAERAGTGPRAGEGERAGG